MLRRWVVGEGGVARRRVRCARALGIIVVIRCIQRLWGAESLLCKVKMARLKVRSFRIDDDDI